MNKKSGVGKYLIKSGWKINSNYEKVNIDKNNKLDDLIMNITKHNVKNRIRFFGIFKKGYEPNWEDEKIVNGGVYQIEFVKNMIINNIVLELNKLMNKNRELCGIRVKSKKEGTKKLYSIQVWSTKNKNDKIMSEIQNIFKKFDKVNITKGLEYHRFFPEPTKESDVLSYTEVDGNKIYYLRFDLGISQFLSKGMWWETFLHKYFKKYYKEGTNILDIGANIGTHTIILGKMVSQNNIVYAFDPLYYDILEKNAKVNNLQDRVCVFSQGVGSKNEIIKVKVYDRYQRKPFGQVSFAGLNPNEDLKVEKEIGIISLDSLNLNNVSLIKIDVEGMELDVLKGGRETIKRNRPVIFIEILKPKLKEVKNSDIMKYVLNECKYNLVPIKESYNHDDYILVPK